MIAVLLVICDVLATIGSAHERIVNRVVTMLGAEPIIPTSDGDTR